MQSITQPELATSRTLEELLGQLAAVAPSESPFLTCYLDARDGRDACLAFLQDKAALIRSRLAGAACLDFEGAFAMLLRQLDQAWHEDVQGLAMFARATTGGRHLSVMRFATPFENSLVLYRMPELLPLLDRRQHEPAFALLLARHRRVQLLGIDLGRATPRAWAASPALGQGGFDAGSAGLVGDDPVAQLHGPLQRLRKVVSLDHLPLVIAGDGDVLPALKDWLPRRTRARVIDSFALPARLEQGAAIAAVRARVDASRRSDSAQLAARLLGAMHARGPAVAGQLATHEALREGRVETLVVAIGARNGEPVYWDAAIELSRLACQQGARVVPADSDQLRDLGGVGCLLRQRADSLVMPPPARLGHLDLVA